MKAILITAIDAIWLYGYKLAKAIYLGGISTQLLVSFPQKGFRNIFIQPTQLSSLLSSLSHKGFLIWPMGECIYYHSAHASLCVFAATKSCSGFMFNLLTKHHDVLISEGRTKNWGHGKRFPTMGNHPLYGTGIHSVGWFLQNFLYCHSRVKSFTHSV